MKKILAIDFSTGSKKDEGTGYAFRKADGSIIVGSILPYASKLTAHERTYKIVNEMKEIIKEHNLEGYHLAIETPIMGRNKKHSITLANCNGYFIGAIDGLVNGFTFIDNSKWCAYHLITGKREQRKEESLEILRASGLVDKNCKDDNIADAYGILLYAESLG